MYKRNEESWQELLDDLNAIKKVDPNKQLDKLEEWPKLVQEGYKIGKSVNFENNRDISNLIVTGMGGSAISGEFLLSWLENRIKIPVIVNKKYSLPIFDNSLVLSISYSGNTEETISVLNQILKFTQPVLISSNGAFEEIARAKKLLFIKLPAGYQPRYAFPLIFFAIVGFLESNGFIPEVEQEVSNTVSDLKEFISSLVKEVPVEKNKAKQMAMKLLNSVPLILSTHSCLGHRFKGQINENAKMVCYYDVFPEMFHNTIVGWESDSINNYKIVKIKLGSDLQKLHTKLKSVLIESEYHGEVLEMVFERKYLLQELMLSVAFTDFVSTYLAILNGKDPSNVPQIDKLKKNFAFEQEKELNLLKSNHNL
ncbi:MAG: bifunctional phosphoglucose/phosphomannose isomerase [Candidatus Hodarchaeales archaeon]|jgi:glucose/mannose-6-phosphate isomerase